MLTVKELQNKQVVKVSNGKFIGYVVDLEMDERQGCIRALVVEGMRMMPRWLQKGGTVLINWSQVVKIGEQLILVETREVE